MTVHFECEVEEPFSFDYKALMRKVIEETLDYVECPYETEVNVVITDNKQIQEVNAEYRNIDKATDVLSFPMIDFSEPEDFSDLEEEIESYFHPETGELLLGDIMISKEKVLEQAKEYGHSVERELGFLTAHSMLHLCGHDHMEEEERIVMEEKQKAILDRLQITRE